MASSTEVGSEGGMVASAMNVADLDLAGIDFLDSNLSLSQGLMLHKEATLDEDGPGPLDSASPFEETAGSWEEDPSSRDSDSFNCSHSKDTAGELGGAEGLAYTYQDPFADSLGQGRQVPAEEGDTQGNSSSLQGTDSGSWWAAGQAAGPGTGTLDASDVDLMLQELGWRPEGDSAVPSASEEPQGMGSVAGGTSLAQNIVQPFQGTQATDREAAAFVGATGSTGDQWVADWTSQDEGRHDVYGPAALPPMAGQLEVQPIEEGRMPSIAAAQQHGCVTKQAPTSGAPACAVAMPLPGLRKGLSLGREQAAPGMASGVPGVGRALPPYAAAQSARNAPQVAPEPGAKRKRGRKKAQPEPHETKEPAPPEKPAARPEPLVPKASLESKPADLAARLARLVNKPDEAEASLQETDQGFTGCAPGLGQARLCLEELDEQPGDEEGPAEGDRGYTKTRRAGSGASAPGAPPGSQAATLLSRDPTEWSMPSGEGWRPGDGAPRAFGAVGGGTQQEWLELFVALDPCRKPLGHSLELADLTPLEGPGSVSWLTPGAPGAPPPRGGSGAALALGPARRVGMRGGGGGGGANPWGGLSGPFQVSQASFAMGAGGRRSSGSIRVWTLPKGILEAMSPLDRSLRERLLCLAEAVASGDQRAETALIPALQQDACPMGSPVQRTVHMFVNALQKRLRGEALRGAGGPAMPTPALMKTTEGVELMRFMEQMPYRPFWLQACTSFALHAVEGHAKVHIVEIGPWIGAWRLFFCELAAAKGHTVGTPRGKGESWDAWAFPGDWELSKVFRSVARETESGAGSEDSPRTAWRQPLVVRFTVVMIPGGSPRGSGPPVSLPALKEELTLLAAQAGVGLEFSGVDLATGLEDFTPSMVECRPGEVLIVNTNTHLESLLDSSVLRSNPRDNFLKALRALEPAAILVSNMEFELNLPFFLKRFNNALSMCLAMLHSFDDSSPRSSQARLTFEGTVIAKVVTNLVACEGSFVHMRAETLRTMRRRMASLGLEPLPLSPAGFHQLKCVLRAYPSSYDVCLRKGCPQLSWAGIPMVGASAWKPSTVYSSDSE